jgi:hypothetical protein
MNHPHLGRYVFLLPRFELHYINELR